MSYYRGRSNKVAEKEKYEYEHFPEFIKEAVEKKETLVMMYDDFMTLQLYALENKDEETLKIIEFAARQRFYQRDYYQPIEVRRIKRPKKYWPIKIA